MIEVMKHMLSLGLTAVIVTAYAAYALLRPLPALSPTQMMPPPPSSAPAQMNWPAYGAEVIGASGYGILAIHGSDEPIPTASVIKILTALLVLQQKPLQPGEQGPVLTMTQTDVDSYNKYVAIDGSVVRVRLGEQLSEYQALQAMLIPSANNMAETLARWAFGSIDAYNNYANQYTTKLGLNQIIVTDPSGFLPTTVSSPSDLVHLGILALANPVIADIVSQPSAAIPVQGQIYNYNFLLGQHGIIGIKTGNNDQDQGCFLFAAKLTKSSTPITIVGVLADGPDLTTVIRDSVPLLDSADANFRDTAPVTTTTHMGAYRAPWSPAAYIVPAQTVHAVLWQDSVTMFHITADKQHAPLKKGTVVGSLIIHNSKILTDRRVRLVLQSDIPEPSVWWRLTHPLPW